MNKFDNQIRNLLIGSLVWFLVLFVYILSHVRALVPVVELLPPILIIYLIYATWLLLSGRRVNKNKPQEQANPAPKAKQQTKPKGK